MLVASFDFNFVIDFVKITGVIVSDHVVKIESIETITSLYHLLRSLALTPGHLNFLLCSFKQILSLLHPLKLQFFLMLCLFLPFLLDFQINHVLFNHLFISNFAFVQYFLIASFFDILNLHFLYLLFFKHNSMLVSEFVGYLVFFNETFFSLLVNGYEILFILLLNFITNSGIIL